MYCTELYCNSENLSSKCSIQGGRIIVTACQFAWCMNLDEIPVQITVALSVFAFYIDVGRFEQYILLLTEMKVKFPCRFLSWS